MLTASRASVSFRINKFLLPNAETTLPGELNFMRPLAQTNLDHTVSRAMSFDAIDITFLRMR